VEGISAPMPIPVMKRMKASIGIVVAYAVANENTPSNSRLVGITG